MKSIVVAYDQNYGIGAENDLLWLRDLPADLKHFRALTTGHAVIMGRKTYESIGRALPDRQNIIISHHLLTIKGVMVVSNLQGAFESVQPGIDTFVIGGGELFRLAVSHIDRIYATEVHATFPVATVFFPPIDKEMWREVARESHASDERNKYDFDFVVYDRF